MAQEYSVQTCQELARMFAACGVERPLRVERYDAQTELVYQAAGVWPAATATVRLRVEKFVGGGYAGQVYRVKVVAVEDGDIAGLAVGGIYALKLIVPPSAFRTRFRDAIYKLGFGAPFSLQVLPAALRAGSLWQKLIRRAARGRFGDERAVADVLATLVDTRIGSCGEIREWVEGRQWRFEVDDRLDARWRWKPGRPDDNVGSPEYRAKRVFMRELVALMHDMGGPELARQYEWWTCKSQPNVLKRHDAEGDPVGGPWTGSGPPPSNPRAALSNSRGGLVAVDFRAGLALLPFLPMSPADFRLIAQGLARGSLVQFDRGDLDKLRRYVDAHAGEFADLRGALDELASAEEEYRGALPDPTHHHVRLLYDRKLWAGILDGAVTGWRIRNRLDDSAAGGLRKSRPGTLAYAALGAVPLLAGVAMLALAAGALVARATLWATWPVFLAGAALVLAVGLGAKAFGRLWGRGDLRRHYRKLLSSPGYLVRALRARRAEMLIDWHRAGRVESQKALLLAGCPGRFLLHWPLSILPAKLHRALTDPGYAWSAVKRVVSRPVVLYFNAQAREEWLRDMVNQGRRRGVLTDEDAAVIAGQLKEPYIQRYLKNLAVHICMMPVGHLISLAIGLYLALNYGKSFQEGLAMALATVAVFQITPVSPGSLLRGLYVLYLLARTRKFGDYNVAVFLAFFKYVGYLAFPVQMAYRYPALARFMASHWATGAVRAVPVFGEHGALLEHTVFDLFYNYLLTLRRRMRIRQQRRAGKPARLWPAAVVAVGAAAVLAGIDFGLYQRKHVVGGLKQTWYLAFWPVLAAGWIVAAAAGGMRMVRRLVLAVAAAVVVALLAAGCNDVLTGLVQPGQALAAGQYAWELTLHFLWNALYFAFSALLGALLAETRRTDE